MRTILALAFSVCFLSAQAQRISIAPTSFVAWGSTPGFSAASVYHKEFGLHYFHPYKTYHWNPAKENRYFNGQMYSAKPEKNGIYQKDKVYVVYGKVIDPDYETKPTVGFSFSPLHYKDIASLGVIVFDKPFPSKPGQRVNFIIDIGYTFKHFRISYTHISNGWTGKINPGLDIIQLAYLF